MKINLPEIEILFEYAERFYENKIPLKKIVSELEEREINKNSAVDYIYNYGNLIEGKIFTRTMNVISTKYYLDQILKTKGIFALKKALQSLSLHIDYYEGVTKGKVVKRKQLLNEYLNRYNLLFDEYFGEEADKNEKLVEGATKTIKINIYERNGLARKRCIEYHGAQCKVCEFDFEEVYGIIGRSFIHIHHLLELSQIGKEYEVDYKIDLVPVCPNCHAIIHKRKPAFRIEELKELIELQKSR